MYRTTIFSVIYFFILIVSKAYSQPAFKLTPHYDSHKKSGSLYIQIAGYDTGRFCYEWYGPNGFTSNQAPPLRNLDFGIYRVTVTDCNQVIATDYGESCVDGKDYVCYGSATVQGSTCDGFGNALSYYPLSVCGLDDSLTLFSSPVLPDCFDTPHYQWYDGTQKIGLDQDYLKVLWTSEICVHIQSADKSGCQCEAYVCKNVPAVDDNFDIELKLPKRTLKWIPQLSNKSDFLWMITEPVNLSLSITGFDSGVEYSGTIYHSDHTESRQESDIDMIPGRTTALDENVKLTNRGYGRFSLSITQERLGSKFEFIMRDTCDNQYTEKALVPRHLTYSKHMPDTDMELSQSDLSFLRTFVKESISIKYRDINLKRQGWILSNQRSIMIKNKLAYEVFNKEKDMYFLLMHIEDY